MQVQRQQPSGRMLLEHSIPGKGLVHPQPSRLQLRQCWTSLLLTLQRRSCSPTGAVWLLKESQQQQAAEGRCVLVRLQACQRGLPAPRNAHPHGPAR